MNTEANKVIDLLGGTVKTSKICGVTKSAVSQWRDNGIPNPWMRFLKLERPDVFLALEEAAEVTPQASAT